MVTRAPPTDRGRHWGAKPGGRSDQVLAVLRRDGWMTTDQIAAALDVKPTALHGVIELLRTEGAIEKDAPRGPWRLAVCDQERRA